jgi:hypothetical protein
VHGWGHPAHARLLLLWGRQEQQEQQVAWLLTLLLPWHGHACHSSTQLLKVWSLP